MDPRGTRGGLLTVLRNARIVLLGGLTLAVGVVGAAAGWLRSERGTRWLADQVEETVRAQLATGRLEVGAVRVGPGSLVLEDLRLHGAEHDDVAVVPRAVAIVDLAGLVRRHVRVVDLGIPRLTVSLHRTAAGGLDLPALRPAQVSRDGPPTFLPEGWSARARVHAEHVMVDLPDDGWRLERGALDAVVGLSHERLRVSGATLALDLVEPAFGEVEGEVELALRHADLDHLDVRLASPGADVRLDGALPRLLGDAPEVDGEVTAWVARETWERWASALEVAVPSIEIGVAGLLGSVEGALGAPRIGAEVFFAPSREAVFDADPVATASLDVKTVTPIRVGLAGAIPRVEAWRPVGVPLEAGALSFTGWATGSDL
ncbi:MAG: hypothetical protein AAF602_28880, partial [Myxococcota bacterium]